MQFKISSRRETGKEIPESSRLEFSEKFLANNFALSVAEDKHLWVIEERRCTRFTFVENTMSNLPKAKFLGCDKLFCFSSMCKFRSFKNPFAMITSLPKLSLNSEKIYSVATNEKIDFCEPW